MTSTAIPVNETAKLEVVLDSSTVVEHAATTNNGTPNNQQFILFNFILHGVFTNVIGLVGLLGNILCVVILRRIQRRQKCSTNVILAALASFDGLVVITSILMFGFPAVCHYTRDRVSMFYCNDIFPYITPCVYAFGLIAQTGSIYCTLGVTVERYIVICWPFRSANICTYGRTKLAVILIALFSVLYNIPRFFEITWVSKTDPVTNSTTRVEIARQELRKDPTYINVYITWMYLVFMYVLPFGGLSVLNTLMYLDVRRSNARQSTLSASEKKELRLAVMLMTVVVVFQICNILPLIVNILEVFDCQIEELTQVSNMLVTLNSSVNVFIYIIMGEKFQRQFLQWLASNGCLCLVNKLRSRGPNTEQTFVSRHDDIQLRHAVVHAPPEEKMSRGFQKLFNLKKIQERISTNILENRKPAVSTNGGIANHGLETNHQEDKGSNEAIPFIKKIPDIDAPAMGNYKHDMVVENVDVELNQT